jgi:hypothetical protein
MRTKTCVGGAPAWLTLILCFAGGCGTTATAGADGGVRPGKADGYNQGGPPGAEWITSFQPPGQDAGMATHATEVMSLREHAGRLWAATGNWSYDSTAGVRPPPQILVRDDSSQQWTIANTFDDQDASGRYRFVRVTSLDVITDETGANAKLVATLDAAAGQGAVFVFDDATATWIDTQLPPVMSIRSLARFDDPMSKRHLLFAGGGIVASPNHLTAAGIYRGRMDSTHPETGGIVWEAQEASGLQDRVMAFSTALGNLYATDKTHLYVRQHAADGTPTWKLIYAYQGYSARMYANAKISGLRGLTAVDEGGQTFLLCSVEYSGELLNVAIDPADATKVSVQTELDVRSALTAAWGSLATPNVIVAYSDMPSLVAGGEELRLMGLLTAKPGDETSAWFLVRHAGASYELHRVPADPRTRPVSSDPNLGSIRALRLHGSELFVGGFDGAYKPDVDTGWIYERPLASALADGRLIP